jgi:hypothetical protein
MYSTIRFISKEQEREEIIGSIASMVGDRFDEVYETLLEFFTTRDPDLLNPFIEMAQDILGLFETNPEEAERLLNELLAVVWQELGRDFVPDVGNHTSSDAIKELDIYEALEEFVDKVSEERKQVCDFVAHLFGNDCEKVYEKLISFSASKDDIMERESFFILVQDILNSYESTNDNEQCQSLLHSLSLHVCEVFGENYNGVLSNEHSLLQDLTRSTSELRRDSSLSTLCGGNTNTDVGKVFVTARKRGMAIGEDDMIYMEETMLRHFRKMGLVVQETKSECSLRSDVNGNMGTVIQKNGEPLILTVPVNMDQTISFQERVFSQWKEFGNNKSATILTPVARSDGRHWLLSATKFDEYGHVIQQSVIDSNPYNPQSADTITNGFGKRARIEAGRGAAIEAATGAGASPVFTARQVLNFDCGLHAAENMYQICNLGLEAGINWLCDARNSNKPIADCSYPGGNPPQGFWQSM